MKKIAITLLLILCPALQSFAEEKIDWIKSYETGAKLAKEKAKPMLIDFSATWCGPCRVMEQSFWPREEVVELSKKFVMILIDYDKNSTLAEKFQTKGLPNIIFTDPWGNIIKRQKGYGSGIDTVVIKAMQMMPADFMPVREWLAVLEADEKSKTALENLGSFYQDIRAYELSNIYYRRRVSIAENEANAEASEAYLMRIGMNTFKMQELGNAQNMFEEIIRRFPNGKLAERAYVSLITCQAFRKKIGDAEKTLKIFKEKFPSSQNTAEAEMAINQIKSLMTK